METIQPGKYVELGYDLYEVTPDGDKLVHQTSADDPEKIVFGVTPGVIVPLEHAIDGLKPGDSFDVKVSADEAFGPHDPEQVATLPRDIFEVDGKFDPEVIKKGAVLNNCIIIQGSVIEPGAQLNCVIADKNVVVEAEHTLSGYPTYPFVISKGQRV